jgi:hypothetical protein
MKTSFFFFNSILTLLGYFFKNNILISKDLRFESIMTKYSKEYKIKFHSISKNSFFLKKEYQSEQEIVSETLDIQNYFDEEGKVDNNKLDTLLDGLLNKFKEKKNI